MKKKYVEPLFDVFFTDRNIFLSVIIDNANEQSSTSQRTGGWTGFYYKTGDFTMKLCFFGDSITKMGTNNYRIRYNVHP